MFQNISVSAKYINEIVTLINSNSKISTYTRVWMVWFALSHPYEDMFCLEEGFIISGHFHAYYISVKQMAKLPCIWFKYAYNLYMSCTNLSSCAKKVSPSLRPELFSAGIELLVSGRTGHQTVHNGAVLFPWFWDPSTWFWDPSLNHWDPSLNHWHPVIRWWVTAGCTTAQKTLLGWRPPGYFSRKIMPSSVSCRGVSNSLRLDSSTYMYHHVPCPCILKVEQRAWYIIYPTTNMVQFEIGIQLP